MNEEEKASEIIQTSNQISQFIYQTKKPPDLLIASLGYTLTGLVCMFEEIKEEKVFDDVIDSMKDVYLSLKESGIIKNTHDKIKEVVDKHQTDLAEQLVKAVLKGKK